VLPCGSQGMYSERPQGRALTVRQAYSFGREDAADASAAAAVGGRRSWSAGGSSGTAPEPAHDPRLGGDPGGNWGRPPSAGVGSWCAAALLLQIRADEAAPRL